MKLKVEEAGLTPLNGCGSCGEDFTSLRSFDLHFRRDGEDGSRCLDAEELAAKGWVRDARGRWVDAVKAKETREAFARVSESLGAPAASRMGDRVG